MSVTLTQGSISKVCSLKDLLPQDKVVKGLVYPQITALGPNVSLPYEITWVAEYDVPLFKLFMPDKEAHLLWMPWPAQVPLPARHLGYHHHIRPGGAYAVQPRATRCYDYAYAYSGQVHPIEEETPREIQGLYEVTNKLFGCGVNMCLMNDYANGRHYISKHSDDERQFSEECHDVFCWVMGPASRELVLRHKRNGGLVFGIKLPQGLYVMESRKFQSLYTHEIPQYQALIFDHLVKKCAQKHPEFPKEVPPTELGANQRAIVQAAWIQEHMQWIINQGLCPTQQDRTNFEEWSLWRASFTLRHFKDNKRRKV